MFEIRSKLEKELMAYFFLNPGEKHHLHELARILSADPANLNVKLKKLKAGGLFKCEERGNQKIYSLNEKFPLLSEYKSIISKTYGAEDILKKALEKVSGIIRACIFGSYAKGNFDRFSDIDLLVIGDHDSLELTSAVSSAERKMGREINFVEYSPDEYNRLRKTDPFLKTAEKNIIQII